MKYVLIISLVFIVILFFYYRRRHKKLAALLYDKRDDIEKAVHFFDEYLNKTQYFNHRKLVLWTEKYKPLFEFLPKNVSTLPLQKEFLKNIKSLKDYYLNAEKHREEYNKKFVACEINSNKKLFESIERYPLTEKQREAIVIDEDNNLIIAGAGTGKTSTLLGKIIYLVRVRKIKPEKILVLAFTRKAADEIRERIKTKTEVEIDIKTFHKFGLDIISKVEKDKPSLAFDDESGEELKNFINSIYEELLRTIKYQELLSTYFLSYLRPYQSPEKFKNFGEYYKYLKSYRTLKGEILRSLEEIEIANFLYVNNIEYIYENDYEHKTVNQNYSQYKPDFYLTDYKIYIEHFGLIDRSGNVPNWFSSKGGVSAKVAYNESIKWKRTIHNKYGTTLVETFSYEKKEGTLLELFKQRLMHHGVKFSATPYQIIKHFEKKNEFPPFISLVITFLNLMKSNGYGIKELYSMAQQKSLIREEKFLEVFEPIYKKYQIDLREKIKKIDFSDMLIKATDYIQNSKYKTLYQYILIDEFQDMSVGRYKLISNLLNQNLDQRLFCVGDDWQSIYRFTGSDISIITEFEKYFGFTKRIDLDLSFRLNSKVCDFTQKFILKNPKQLKKKLISANNIKEEPFQVVYEDTQRNVNGGYDNSKLVDSESALENCLNSVSSSKNKTSVFIIGRYNFDEPSELSQLKRKYKSCDINFYTAHSSKGLEADYVILINVNSGKYGFPSEIVDDPILSLVLQIQDEIENAEERRLFYVALTRTRNNVFIICNKNNSSKFINEILSENQFVKKCPDCKEGILIKRKNSLKGNEFWGCENYKLCTYTKNILNNSNNNKNLKNKYQSSKVLN